MTITQKVPRRKRKVEKIPSYLVYETLNGKVLPYKGYKEVLAKKKKTSEIMGCSSLQGILVSIIVWFVNNQINRKKYFVATNEIGIHISKNTNISNDIAIFEKEGIILTNQYFEVAPKVVIEIDVKVDIDPDDHEENSNYIIEKAQKMLDFGTEKIIWILTQNKTIFVFSKTETWTLVPFHTDIPVLDDCILNLARLMQDEGIDEF
ncbi:Uma2 family endonuclease [Runella slithyformis]|uniref:Putative restriction endonuclease domain-containing protein n=1 Tax=Runella slithyformis (strain ATCC 29530 / DSM 19594 / LMG 11500 / NCIMB 11436 / LSU 4) TaxID=761193 RepID=A0A7U3ZHQ4_RUNSL|nr:Uma2 family endonuclease [Runella slithyformis]AEI47423.1 hypothetical protein Runsl_0992 [Runella slithyformis DSM 19594]